MGLKIIDCESRGNAARFYLGKKIDKWGWTNPDYRYWDGRPATPSDEYYGDDWNDRPYQDNAGPVYDEFIYDHFDLNVNFDGIILTPADSTSYRQAYSKDDMVDGSVPCVIIVSPRVYAKESKECYGSCSTFDYWLGRRTGNGVFKIYFGDDVDTLKEIKNYLDNEQEEK